MFENFLKTECNIDVNEIVGNTEPGLENAKFSNNENSLAEVDVAILGATGFSQELNQFINRASNLADGIRQVSEIEDVASAAKSEGGLTKREGQLIASQMNGLCGLLEMPSVDVPAMEHFGDVSPRSVATEMVATEAMDTIKKWIDTLIAFVKKQFDALAKLWEKYTEAGQRLKRWAEASLPKIDKLGSIKEGSEKIKYPSILVDKDGKVVDANGVGSGMTNLVSFLEKDVPSVVKYLDKTVSEAKSIAGAGEKSSFWSVLGNAIAEVSFKETLSGMNRDAPGLKIIGSKPQLGNFQLIVGVPESSESKGKAIVKVVDLLSKDAKTDSRESAPMEESLMKSVVGDIKSVADGITQIKKDIAGSKKELDKAIKLLKSNDEKVVRELVLGYQKVAGFYTSGPALAIQKSVITLRAVAGLIDTSIKAHESK